MSDLATTNPNSLSELFSRDPLDLADQDIHAIVVELRRARENWIKGESTGKSGKVAAPKDLKVEDLDL